MMNNNNTTLLTIALPACNRAMRKMIAAKPSVYSWDKDIRRTKKERKTRLAPKITDIRKQGIIFVIGYKIAA